MKIYNTMSGKKEEFKPIKEGEVKMYACGVTVYDLSHIGHARQAIVYAMFADYLRYRGYKVTYVRNYTDVDDKIIKRANEKGKNALEFSKEQIKETEIDMENLHVTDADYKTKASEYIEKIIEFIEGLIEKGYAYKADNGDVYFAVRAFKEYGKLSHRKVDDMLNGVRIELEEGKKDPIDFALWKSAKPGEIYWESPWGKGRPGWHIECSVMAKDTLGESIDIHGGGRDLQFPHHENEIAQSEALSGKTLANYWTHCGLIKINGEKMSKSLGNSLTIRDALKMYNYEVIKYLMFSKHYSSDMDILDRDYLLAESQMYYFYTTIKEMKKFIEQYNGKADEEVLETDISDNIVTDFIEVMDDDFNTAAAIAYLHGIFKYVNNIMKVSKKNNRELTANTLTKILNNINECYGVLGLFKQEPEKFMDEMKRKYLKKLDIDEKYIQSEIEKRLEAKKAKDFDTADKIREDLDKKGIILNDTIEGTFWDVKALFKNS
ncbi:MAG: cysteine--tRNA ligase [Clostridia bacterium]|nr:cysteine--tRNA ligase [Clostridia bacterium]